MKKNKLVAVYGSLRKDMGNHGYLRESNFIGESPITNFKMISLYAYPAVFESDHKEDLIIAEIYEVDEDTFNRLDRLEGYPTSYNRKEIETLHGTAWIYYFDREMSGKERIVESGNWVEFYRKERKEYVV